MGAPTTTPAGVPTRVIVCGSRTWNNWLAITSRLTVLAAQAQRTGRALTVVHGAHRAGADRIASDWCETAKVNGLAVIEDPHPAKWTELGTRAGPIRNAEMAEAGADLCIAFRAPGKSNGTDSMIREARKREIPVEVIHA